MIIDRIIIKGLSLDGYQSHHVPRKDGSGGGLGVLTKSSIQLQLQESLNYTHMEGMEVLAHTGSSKLRIAILYRPPLSPANGLTLLAGFLDNFNRFMEGYISNPGNVLLMGDFNFHIDDPADTSARRFLSLIRDTGLYQHVVGPTHVSGHTLDLVFTRPSDYLNWSLDTAVRSQLDLCHYWSEEEILAIEGNILPEVEKYRPRTNEKQQRVFCVGCGNCW